MAERREVRGNCHLRYEAIFDQGRFDKLAEIGLIFEMQDSHPPFRLEDIFRSCSVRFFVSIGKSLIRPSA